jgi:Na+/proline symporter
VYVVAWWQIYTVPEYLAKRYEGHRLRLLLAVISILLYITTR